MQGMTGTPQLRWDMKDSTSERPLQLSQETLERILLEHLENLVPRFGYFDGVVITDGDGSGSGFVSKAADLIAGPDVSNWIPTEQPEDDEFDRVELQSVLKSSRVLSKDQIVELDLSNFPYNTFVMVEGTAYIPSPSLQSDNPYHIHHKSITLGLQESVSSSILVTLGNWRTKGVVTVVEISREWVSYLLTKVVKAIGEEMIDTVVRNMPLDTDVSDILKERLQCSLEERIVEGIEKEGLWIIFPEE